MRRRKSGLDGDPEARSQSAQGCVDGCNGNVVVAASDADAGANDIAATVGYPKNDTRFLLLDDDHCVPLHPRHRRL